MTTADAPKSNQTSLGLYATPREAYGMWEADPEGVTILDVRSFEESVFAGHPPMARNVPLAFLKHERPSDAPQKSATPGALPAGFSIEPNTGFMAAVRET